MTNSTHRQIQLSTLREIAESKISQLIRAAVNARTINNKKAYAHFLGRAAKYISISHRAARRMA